MKKVLLVRPEESRTKYDFKGIIENEPLDLEIICGLLKDEYEVRIYDLQIEKQSLSEHLKDHFYDVLYVEGRAFQESFMKEYVSLFRKRCGGLIIIGGQHAQLNFERFYEDDADYILSGCNYYDLPKITKGNIEGVFNLHYRVNGEWHSSERRAVDINDLPLPDRSQFYSHPSNYRYLDLEHAMWIRSAFACPYKCAFCIRRLMNAETYSRRSVESLVDEIAMNDNENVYLVDDDFLFDERYVGRFIELIRERKIERKYICYGRADFISTHEELMKQFREIGLSYVLTGLEDIRNDRLSSYNKLSSVENNESCIRVCQDNKIRIMAMFILGLDFTGKDFRDLYRYIVKKDLKNVAVSIYTPELGVSDVEYITNDPCDFDYLHLVCKPEKMSVRQYYIHYYVLLIRLFIRAFRQGVYGFLDYRTYIRSFIRNIFTGEHG